MLSNYRIGDLVEIPSVQTVVRLENSKDAVQSAAGTFVFTSEVDKQIQVLAQALGRLYGQGYFLQGDFGSGKSHFLAALAAFLSGYDTNGTLEAQHEGLKRLHESGKRFLPVTISLVNFRGTTPLEKIITESMEETLRTYDITIFISERSNFLRFFKGILKEREIANQYASFASIQPDRLFEWIDSNKAEAYASGVLFVKNKGLAIPDLPMMDRHATFQNAVQKILEQGFAGIVLLLDELSEFFRSKPDAPSLNEDARTLQLLGEISRSNQLWIIAAVQESIERTGDIAQVTFRKIKDRFPVKLHLSTLHIRDLIAKRLVKKKPGADQHILGLYNEYCRHFPGFNFTAEFFLNIYPVHPLTISLLEGLGDLFSQHRGIVDFIHTRLAGDESKNVTGILDRHSFELLAPDAIYEHFADRIAEFSSFYIYPSQIIPHLDEVIDTCIEDEADRILARRLIRIIVLYAIHPTASAPSARLLAELASCMVSSHDPEANAQYIAEVLLDPVVEKSRFLNKSAAGGGNSLDAAYSVTTSDDQNKVLRARIERTMKELSHDDSRVFSVPLAELPESFSWPGPALWNSSVEKSIIWCQSTRRAAVFLLHSGNEYGIEQKIEELIDKGEIDFALVLATEKKLLHCKYTAVWLINDEYTEDAVLKEYFACRMVAGEMRSANPADAALIPLLKEQIRKLEPAARQVVLNLIFGGTFTDQTLEVDFPVRQLKRFDRLLEIAGEQILENRYPRFKEIASRSLPPSPRYYQRIFEEFVTIGSITMRDARTQGLSELIETMAVPLGLVDVKAGNYILAPNVVGNQFLSAFFTLLSASGHTSMPSLLLKLQTGPYGVTRDCACFLIASLAYCGHIALINRGRTLPLEFIKATTVDQVEMVAPGEIICEADRKTIIQSCAFLAGSGPIDTFGLKQQRDAWQALLKFKTGMITIVNDIDSRIPALGGYSAFKSLDTEIIVQKCKSLDKVLEEIKVSYSAREGLERFLAAWRASELSSEDITSLKQIHRFMNRHIERIVFISHYINHRSVTEVSSIHKTVADRRDAVVVMLRNIEQMIIPDEGANFQNTFEAFRESFAQIYIDGHMRFQKKQQKLPLSKHLNRALDVIKRLSSIPSLDCPRGTRQLIQTCDKPSASLCTRNVAEELLRSPLCNCGYICGEEPAESESFNTDSEIDRVIQEYIQILCHPEIIEAISARAFALRDVDKKAYENLDRLLNYLRNNKGGSTLAFRDLLDESKVSELGRALTGQVKIENRSLKTLQSELSGRRLSPSRIKQVVNNWIGNAAEDTIISLIESGEHNAYNAADPLLWPFLHCELFANLLNEHKNFNLHAQSLAMELERNFPSEKLSSHFVMMSEKSLAEFACNEPVHLRAIESAWNILADRIITCSGQLSADKIYSKYVDETESVYIKHRMSTLRNLSDLYREHYPQRLRIRSAAVALYKDPWATTNLKNSILNYIEKIANDGQDWFDTLQSLPAIDTQEHEQKDATILLIDAIPADVWLDILAASPDIFSPGEIRWFRLTGKSMTIDSINELFGFSAEKDPLNELAARGIDYGTIRGDEERKWSDIVPLPLQGGIQLIRLSLFDSQVHAGTMSLEDMAPTLTNLLTKNLPSFIELCKEKQRKLIITTDHGLTFSAKGLQHGSGGVYEKAIFRFAMNV